jgi:ABC-2 type transport system ATP-binding protein
VAVVLRGVGKRYGRRRPWVLREIDLRLEPGTLTLITGLNGSGKTTLLRIVAGLSRPTRGTVAGRPRRVAVVPDKFVPPVRMTATAYLRHHGRIRGLTAAQAGERAEKLAATLGIMPGLGFRTEDLSKGNAQKVGVAQAFMGRTDLLVLDEPGAALDSPAARALQALVDDAVADGSIVVVGDPAPAPSLAGARRYQLGSGCVEAVAGGPATDEEAVVTVRLRPAGDRPPDRLPPHDLGGVVLSSEGDLTLAIAEAKSDETLRRALAGGWSVVEVRRSEGAEERL